MGQVVTDTKNPNWGISDDASASGVDDPKNPDWGLPERRQSDPSSRGALVMQGAAAAVPAAERAAMEVATSPAVPKAVGALARRGTTAAGIVHGLATGNVPEVIYAPSAGWRAGKAGYFLGKGLQKVAAPIARAAEAVAPYAQALSTASGAQGVLDLAQMADPDRQDIGVLGVGGKADILGNPEAIARVIKASPSIGDAVANLTQLGMSQTEAIAAVLTLKWKGRIPAKKSETP